MREKGLNLRLMSAVGFVRQGAVFADIGTDHAYLPLFLLSEGRIERAVLSDINEGPLESARRNAWASGYADRVELILTDGAASLADKGITDYAICGMGGELIAQIIDLAPHLRNSELNLILQPMSRQSVLRKYLASAGFRIMAESYSIDVGKLYVCMQVKFDGVSREISDADAEFGEKNIDIVNKDLQKEFVLRKKQSLLRAIDGKRRGGEDTTAEEALVAAAEELISV